MKDYIENFDWDEVHPFVASILSIVSLFGGFGLIKLSYVIGGWWLIVPTWIVCLAVILIVCVATLEKLFGD